MSRVLWFLSFRYLLLYWVWADITWELLASSFSLKLFRTFGDANAVFLKKSGLSTIVSNPLSFRKPLKSIPLKSILILSFLWSTSCTVDDLSPPLIWFVIFYFISKNLILFSKVELSYLLSKAILLLTFVLFFGLKIFAWFLGLMMLLLGLII